MLFMFNNILKIDVFVNAFDLFLYLFKQTINLLGYVEYEGLFRLVVLYTLAYI